MFIQKFKIQGESMEPAYKNGDHVLIWKYGKLKTGDVIIFKKNALTMIKRIHKIENNRFTVKGDNWQKSDENFGTLEKNEIVGKVILKYA